MTAVPKLNDAFLALQARLDRLLGYLKQDPLNDLLVEDALQTALALGSFERARELIVLRQTSQGESEQTVNWFALIDLAEGRIDRAQGRLERWANHHALGLKGRFNLACCFALADAHNRCLALLDDEVVESIADAAPLRMRCQHALGDLDAARSYGLQLLASNSNMNREAVLAQMSTLEIDEENFEKASEYARQAPQQPESMTTFGLLDLEAERYRSACQWFERVIGARPRSGRAWLGLGLALLGERSFEHAQSALNQAALLMPSHQGSMIALGWAQLMIQAFEPARGSFEKALQIDRNFSEAHGSLALADLLLGHSESAERSLRTALQLDPNCMSAALAQAIQATSRGDAQIARQAMLKGLGNRQLLNSRSLTRLASRLGR